MRWRLWLWAFGLPEDALWWEALYARRSLLVQRWLFGTRHVLDVYDWMGAWQHRLEGAPQALYDEVARRMTLAAVSEQEFSAIEELLEQHGNTKARAFHRAHRTKCRNEHHNLQRA